MIKNASEPRGWSPDKSSAISQGIMALASVLTLILLLFNSMNKLPDWLIFTTVIIAITGIFLLSIKVGRKILSSLSQRRIANSNFPTLISLCKQFQDLISLRMTDTIVYTFGNMQQAGVNFQMREFADLSEWITNNLIARLESSKRGFIELRQGIRDLHALTHSFHRTYFIEGIKKVRSLGGTSNILDEDKRVIEVARESFARYLERFQTFSSEINEKIGRKEFDYYFEKAKPL